MGNRKKGLCIVGHTRAAYRTGEILKAVCDARNDFSVIFLHENSFEHCSKLFYMIARTVILFLSAIGCDALLVLPMGHNNSYTRLAIKLFTFFRKKIIVDFYISDYETFVVDRKVIQMGSRYANDLLTKEQQLLKNTNQIIFLNKSERKYYTNLLGISNGDLKSSDIIPLVAQHRPKALLPFFNKLADSPTIVWWGIPGNPIHGFDLIVEAVQLSIERNLGYRFALFPAKNYTEYVTKYASVLQHENVLFSFEYSFSNGTLVEFIKNDADISLGTFGQTKKAQTVIPNKVIEGASFGMPVISIKSDGLAEYFDNGCSIRYCDATPESLLAAIEELVNNKPGAKKMGEQANVVYYNHFSSESFSKKLRTTLLSLLDPK